MWWPNDASESQCNLIGKHNLMGRRPDCQKTKWLVWPNQWSSENIAFGSTFRNYLKANGFTARGWGHFWVTLHGAFVSVSLISHSEVTQQRAVPTPSVCMALTETDNVLVYIPCHKHLCWRAEVFSLWLFHCCHHGPHILKDIIWQDGKTGKAEGPESENMHIGLIESKLSVWEGSQEKFK